jgi:ubiquinone/menaquinone biosynthesis C-methylase UbiE
VKHLRTPYFEGAERVMDAQWAKVIRPRIEGSDFRVTLDLACGYGRNAAKLRPLCREMHLVDVNQHCIEACRARFAAEPGAVMHYWVNDGCSLPFIPDGAVTFVYSWDAMVHFDTLVVEKYIHEFARIMTPGGRGFIHHSNFGSTSPNSEWLENPHWRSNTSREDVARYCQEAGLEIVRQDLHDWGAARDLDCLSLFRKPDRR